MHILYITSDQTYTVLYYIMIVNLLRGGCGILYCTTVQYSTVNELAGVVAGSISATVVEVYRKYGFGTHAETADKKPTTEITAKKLCLSHFVAQALRANVHIKESQSFIIARHFKIPHSIQKQSTRSISFPVTRMKLIPATSRAKRS